MPKEPNYSKRELDHFMRDLKNDLKEGFGGINARLDKLNGKVAEHEAKFGQMSVDVAVNKTKLGWIGAISGAVVGGVVSYLVKINVIK